MSIRPSLTPYDSRRSGIFPAGMDELLKLSGLELGRKIRDREASSREVVEAHIARIEAVNPVINAVVAERFDEARKEARLADEALARCREPRDLPLYHGVPCTIKESFALTGMPNTSGLPARKGILAVEDASAVGRVRRAGAIPLGVTNVSELCMWMESSNRVYGRTRNPYDPSRIVGGSSGGEGAIIGAGGSPFGLGSDIGGSVRMPAFFNGVFGHKPTGGLVPGTGQYPYAEGAGLRYLTTGPICRRAEDLMPLLRIMAGPDGKDAGCLPFNLGDPAAVRVEELAVLDVEDNGATPVHEDLRKAQRMAAEYFARKGAKVKSARIPSLMKSFDIWSSMLSDAQVTSFRTFLGDFKPLNPWIELLKWAAGRSGHTFPAIALAAVEKFEDLMPDRKRRMIEAGRALRRELVEAIGPNGVMLYPSYSRPAPKHNRPLRRPFDWVYTAIFNVMEFPATQASLGLNAEGLPVGVQCVAGHGNDHLAIRCAIELEKTFGGWTPPDHEFTTGEKGGQKGMVSNLSDDFAK